MIRVLILLMTLHVTAQDIELIEHKGLQAYELGLDFDYDEYSSLVNKHFDEPYLMPMIYQSVADHSDVQALGFLHERFTMEDEFALEAIKKLLSNPEELVIRNEEERIKWRDEIRLLMRSYIQQKGELTPNESSLYLRAMLLTRTRELNKGREPQSESKNKDERSFFIVFLVFCIAIFTTAWIVIRTNQSIES